MGIGSRSSAKVRILGQVLGRMLPGLAIGTAGCTMLLLAQDQAVWLGGHVGPGLFARLLGLGVIGLGVAWAVICARGSDVLVPSTGCATGSATRGTGASGPALLGAVVVFALSLPFLGLMLSSGVAAGLTAWGAGERKPRAMAITVVSLMALVALVGMTLLPPTAPLWPSV
jgi:hypothetical protein